MHYHILNLSANGLSCKVFKLLHTHGVIDKWSSHLVSSTIFTILHIDRVAIDKYEWKKFEIRFNIIQYTKLTKTITANCLNNCSSLFNNNWTLLNKASVIPHLL